VSPAIPRCVRSTSTGKINVITLPAFVIDAIRAVPFKGKSRLLSPFVPRDGEVVATVFGYRMQLDLSDLIQRHMYMGSYERADTRRASRILKRGDTMLDVGANAGHYTFLAASRVGPTGSVVAVEPSTWVADRLAKTVEANGVRNVYVKRCALGNERGKAELGLPLHGNHTPSLLEDDPGRAHVTVDVVPLDDVIDEWVPGGQPIALMKMDVEGFEPRVLCGGSRTLSQGRIRHLLVEFNGPLLSRERAGSSPRQLADQIASLDFTPATPLPPLAARSIFTHLFKHRLQA
jgi:FkbM family methyltransferase